MNSKLSITSIFIALVLATGVLATTIITTKAFAASVPLIPIDTGNARLDKAIQKFYNCIKDTGHTGGSKPEPSRAEVNDCFAQVFNEEHHNSNNNHVTHIIIHKNHRDLTIPLGGASSSASASAGTASASASAGGD